MCRKCDRRQGNPYAPHRSYRLHYGRQRGDTLCATVACYWRGRERCVQRFSERRSITTKWTRFAWWDIRSEYIQDVTNTVGDGDDISVFDVYSGVDHFWFIRIQKRQRRCFSHSQFYGCADKLTDHDKIKMKRITSKRWLTNRIQRERKGNFWVKNRNMPTMTNRRDNI